MGKCKVCGTEIPDNEEMCEDCKALDDVDLIKSDEELEALLNSVMHSPTSYTSDDTYVAPTEMTIDPIEEKTSSDNDDIANQLNSIANDLLDQYTTEEDKVTEEANLSNQKESIDYSYEEDSSIKDPMFTSAEQPDSAVEEEEPFSIDSVTEEEEEPFSIDSVTEEEEEPFSIDSVTEEEEEPFSIDSVTKEEEEAVSVDSAIEEEEEPFSIDSVTEEEEEPFSIDSATEEEEEPFSIDSVTEEEEEPVSVDSITEEEEEPFSIDSFDSEEPQEPEEEPLSLDSLMSEENTEPSNDLYSDIPGYEGIFDGIEDTDDKDNSLGDVFADVLGTVSNYGADKDEKEDSKPADQKDKKEKKKGFGGWFATIENPDAEEEYERDKQLAEEKAAKKAAKKEEKAAKAAEKKAKAAETKKAKDEAKAAKKAAKAAQAEEEAKQDYNKINKKGAAVVLIAFACLGVIIVIGSQRFSYSSSVKQAEDYFVRRKYTKAYNQISGIDVKKADRELADKIKTVMYVNKEYDSYNNYYTIQYYAEALNSLLNGLTKYDMYIEQASELGVKTDLQYVKSQIVDELETKYQLNEKNAKKILQIEDQEKYSDKVFSIAEKLVEKKKK